MENEQLIDTYLQLMENALFTDLYLGDCVEVMKEMEANSVDTIICDPPYGLEFMGKNWDKLGATIETVSEGMDKSHPFRDGTRRIRYGKSAASMQEWHYRWAVEALRVAKPGAFMLAMGGTRTFHRLACAIEDAGWEIRDCMMWLYGSGFPKSHNISKAIDKVAGVEREVIGHRKQNGAKFKAVADDIDNKGFNDPERTQFDITAPATADAQTWNSWGTALKPAWEPILVAMKPRDGTFANNALKWGVAGLWIDGTRINPGTHIPAGGSSWGKSEHTHEGWKRPAHEHYQPTPAHSKGRWPANVILDEEAAVMLDRQSGILKPATSRTPAGRDAIERALFGGGNAGPLYADTGGASRFFYCAKSSRRERTCNATVENGHPTVKPLALMEYLCRLTKTPTGGVVLDPFMGSGTTGMACVKTGRSFIGIEISEEYYEIADKRILWQMKQEGLEAVEED